MKSKDPTLFGPVYERESRQLPVIGEQKDIRYYSSPAKSVLNGPETTGMGFWSINPYIGCAFGCAYCYARYAHRYVLERAATANPEHDGLQGDIETMPPWLAFERRIFVKENAAEVLRRVLRHGSDRHLALLGITDAPEQLDRLVRTVAEHGATYVNACALRLQSAARQRYLPFIEQEFPELSGRYRATYSRSHSVGTRYRDGLRDYFKRVCALYGVPFGHGGDGGEEDTGADPRRVAARKLAEQLGLGL